MEQIKTETSFTLDNFEGPLDFLWHLVQKNEIDIYEIHLQKITGQYLEMLKKAADLSLDFGAEFIATAACLLWIKSKQLLPKHEQEQLPQEEEQEDPRFEIIHSLIDYSRFKEAAKDLSEREQQQNGIYSRGSLGIESQKNLGIEHLSLDDLANLFKQVLAKAGAQKGQLEEEVWKVSDKIDALSRQLKMDQKIPFDVIFSSEKGREELIVLFLAILELMKMGEARVVREVSNQRIMIMSVNG